MLSLLSLLTQADQLDKCYFSGIRSVCKELLYIYRSIPQYIVTKPSDEGLLGTKYRMLLAMRGNGSHTL